MIYNYKGIDVALWQQTKPDFCEWRYAGGARASIPVAAFEHLGLQYVGDNIAMRNHHSFLLSTVWSAWHQTVLLKDRLTGRPEVPLE